MADVEQLLAQALAARFPDDRAVTETPADLEQFGRVVQVGRAGGARFLTLDRPRIVLHAFAIAGDGLTARDRARKWALELDAYMRNELPHSAIDAAVWVTTVTGQTLAVHVPEINPALRHFTNAYTLGVSAVA